MTYLTASGSGSGGRRIGTYQVRWAGKGVGFPTSGLAVAEDSCRESVYTHVYQPKLYTELIYIYQPQL